MPIARRATACALAVLTATAATSFAQATAKESPAATATPFRLAPCRVPDLTEEVRCGTYPVWEDREARSGRKIGLYVVVLPALGPHRLPDPIVFLAGGPGESVTPGASDLAREKELRLGRDVLLVDQRGTGHSNPLDCTFYGSPLDQRKLAGDLLPLDAVRSCRALLEQRADLRFYTTTLAMDDLDEVRRALGYAKVNLVGGSYGSRAAQVYLRRHGESVRSAILDGVAPVDEPVPLHHAYAGQRAIDLLLGECFTDPACKAAFPHAGEELKAVMERVDRGVTVRVIDPLSGKQVEVRPTRGLVAEGIRFLMYGPGGADLPRQIHRAALGDLQILVKTALDRRAALDDDLDMGMFLSVTCAEDLPFIDAETAKRATAGTLLGDYRIQQQKRACEVWPRGAIPKDARELVHSDVPVLLVSGERDPVTPPEFGARVASHLPHSLHVVLPRGGHGGQGGCIETIEQSFLDRGSVEGLDISCVKATPPTRFNIEPPPG